MMRSLFARLPFAAAIGVACCGLACGGGSNTKADSSSLGGAGGGAGGAAGGAGGGAGDQDAGLPDLGTPDAGGPGLAAGQFVIVYDKAGGGTYTSSLTTCLDCTARYDFTSGIGVMTFVMANGSPEMTTVSVTVQTGNGGSGYAVGVSWLEQNSSLPTEYQGPYYFTNAATAKQVEPGSCVMLSSVDLRLGGGAAGSFDCTFFGGAATNHQTATARGTFSAQFAN